MRVVVFEDCRWRKLFPLTELRPVWDLSLGMGRLSDRLKRALPNVTWWPRPELREICTGPLFNPEDLGDEPLLLVNGAVCEPETLAEKITLGKRVEEVYAVGEERCLIWARLESGEAKEILGDIHTSDPRFIERFLTGERSKWLSPPKGGAETSCLFRRPWELVERNAEALRRDFAVLTRRRTKWKGDVQGDPALVFIEEGALVERGVVFSTAGGPVVVATGAELRAPSRIEGPCYIGPKTIVDSAQIRPGCSFGQNCRVSGEVEASVFADHVNKHHYGFIGHSYVGEWVNLGAGTTNSDLKNTYGEVRAHGPEGRVPTGLDKAGCFLGDHVKLGIGTLVGTGVCIGPFSNVFNSPPVGGYVPPFSWGSFGDFEANEPAKALEVAGMVMARRGVELTPGYRRFVERLAERYASSR
ncbi:MAG TPA: putative sugar nucleotidyl transferase [bacterium]|nr:putative sugar nucleotidyl transferase [bacterium]